MAEPFFRLQRRDRDGFSPSSLLQISSWPITTIASNIHLSLARILQPSNSVNPKNQKNFPPSSPSVIPAEAGIQASLFPILSNSRFFYLRELRVLRGELFPFLTKLLLPAIITHMINTSVNILAIETSCDETSAAVVADGSRVLSSIVAGQDELHSKYGGVVPEIASRAHIQCINPVIAQALDSANLAPSDISAVAVANRPGLIGSLLIGVSAAKTLAWSWSKPLIDIDHVQAHIYAACLDRDSSRPFPAIALVVSGGHTSLYYCHDPLSITELGSTIDDAAGEAFDKVATILQLGYPGGPLIDKLSRQGNPQAVDFPRSWLSKESLDFSFSGIKTAVLYHVKGQNARTPRPPLNDQDRADVAASFQQAVVDVLVGKTMRALSQNDLHNVIVGGGVSANSALRSAMSDACQKASADLFLPPTKYCTDNAAMVAGLAYHKFRANLFADLSLTAQA